MLLAAIARGEMSVVLGTAGLRASIASRLSAAGCDLAAMRADARYCEFDAADAISQVMRNGRLDRGEVARMVDDLERLRLGSGPRARTHLTLFGEMAGLLLQDGHPEAAVQLEQTWGELTRALPYHTICSYSARTLHAERYPDVWMAMCAEHSAVCHAARLQ
jgi:hypothetical protein